MQVCIYWTCSRQARLKICKRFGIRPYLMVNGETYCTIRKEDTDLFFETMNRGFFKLRNNH